MDQISKNGFQITTMNIFSLTLGLFSAQGRNLAPIFINLSQSENLYEIERPLMFQEQIVEHKESTEAYLS